MAGSLEVICGPMFSGKSEELMRRLRREEIAGKNVVVIKPAIDNRYSEDEVASHSGIKMKAAPCDLEKDSLIWLSGSAEVVGIDEIQFFSYEALEEIQELVEIGCRVIVSGLDMDAWQEPFGIIPYLLATADKITKLDSVCHSCGGSAMFSQRLSDGKAVPKPIKTNVFVGATDSYEARCRNCYERVY